MKKKGGKIINIASTAGQRGEAGYSHYAASKAAVIAFTKSIAAELAPMNILVNCVAPGWVSTDMTSTVLRNRTALRAIERTIPRGRVATPEDIAGPVLFLASDLSDHLVGTTLSVNGGGLMAT
jgi:3-oxoacyl-[acyl-carrier protein] reductase